MRICDQGQDFTIQSHIMTNASTNLTSFQKPVKRLQHETELFFCKTENINETYQTVFTTTYSTPAPGIKQIIKSSWNTNTCGQTLRALFPNPPTFSYRKGPFIKDILTHSYLTADNNEWWLRTPVGTYKCGICNHCDNMVWTQTFTDLKTVGMEQFKKKSVSYGSFVTVQGMCVLFGSVHVQHEPCASNPVNSFFI